MFNKRVSAVVLSLLLAFSPMYSSVYASTVLASENEVIVDTDKQDSEEAIIIDADDQYFENETLQTEVKEDTVPEFEDNEDTVPEFDNTEGENAQPVSTNPVDDPYEGDENDEDPCAINGHSWDNGVIDKAATCTTEGEMLFKCTECGEIRYETIAPNGHKFGEWTVITAPTTRVDGLSERVCSVCGETESKVVAHTVLKVKSIRLSRTSAVILKGKTLQLSAAPQPSNATSTAVIWKTNNAKIATVTSTGKVTAKAPGTATIICMANDGSRVRALCNITVKIGVSKISLNQSAVCLNKGKAIVLKAAVSPSNAANKAVTWTSSNTNVATVTSTGRVTAKAKGMAIITCTAKDGSGTKATCKIAVRIPVTKITLNKTSATIKKGKSLALSATVGPASANNKSVAWRSSNTSVATVSSNGTVTAKAKGTATITCIARDGSGVKATCAIKVTVSATSGGSGSGSGSSGGGSSSGSGGSSGGGYVWISATGSKYHRINNCGTMNPNKATKMSESEARSRGYSPCSKCY